MNPAEVKRLLLLAMQIFTVAGIGYAGIALDTAIISVKANPELNPALHARQSRAAEIDARFKQGVMMLHAKQYEHAVTALHRVLELAPDMPEAHVNMGFAMLGLERYDVARDFFESATDLRPNQVNAYYGLAIALEGLHDLPGALGAMQSYIHLNKGAEDAYMRKARSAVWEWQEALNQEKNKEEKASAKPAAETPKPPADTRLSEGGKNGKK